MLHHINELGLDLKYLIGKGYDGAASMSSERVGVCSVIKTAAPLADYFHCCMHALNLSCSRATKIPAIRHCMDDIKDINNFFKHAKRKSYLQKVIARESSDDLQRRQLVTLCETRLVERHESVLVAKQLLPCIAVCLNEMLAWDLPCFVKETNWQDILPAVTKYASFLDPLSIVEGEYEIWRQQWLSCEARPVANTAIGALGNCQADVFPNVHTLLDILTALPVTTAEPERLFSKFNSTLTAIRSTMSEERLESLLLLQVHRERIPTTQKLIDPFAATKSRRLPLKL